MLCRHATATRPQPLLAYDTLLANFEPALERVPPPASPEPLLEHLAHGLTTAEVAPLLAEARIRCRASRRRSVSSSIS
jgi:hypothetical protein